MLNTAENEIKEIDIISQNVINSGLDPTTCTEDFDINLLSFIEIFSDDIENCIQFQLTDLEYNVEQGIGLIKLVQKDVDTLARELEMCQSTTNTNECVDKFMEKANEKLVELPKKIQGYLLEYGNEIDRIADRISHCHRQILESFDRLVFAASNIIRDCLNDLLESNDKKQISNYLK